MVIGILRKGALCLNGITPARNVHTHISHSKEDEPQILYSHGIRKSRLPSAGNGHLGISKYGLLWCVVHALVS
jgi:hypothetical protein